MGTQQIKVTLNLHLAKTQLCGLFQEDVDSVWPKAVKYKLLCLLQDNLSQSAARISTCRTSKLIAAVGAVSIAVAHPGVADASP